MVLATPLNPLSREFTRAVAERRLVLVTPGSRRTIVARLGEPVQDVPTAGDNDWRCPVQIEGWDHTPPPGVGVDSLQALLHGLKVLHIYLTHIEHQSGGVLHWLEDSGHLVPDIPVTT